MPTYPRYLIIDNNSLFHVTWQCHNKDFLFNSEWAKQTYYDLLLKYKDRYKVQIYSYCFMSNHPHLTGFCEDKELFSDFFRTVHSLFARMYNKKHSRRGQFVMDRFKSPKIESLADLEKVMHYIDLNPKRANMVLHPKDYKWSSFHFYAYGKEDPLLTPSPSYKDMGANSKERQTCYLKMVENILKDDWKVKKPYSSTCFIGNPNWVSKKYHMIKSQNSEKLKQWKEKFKIKFCNSS